MRGRRPENIPQGLKPRILSALCGPAKAVPWLQSHLFNQLKRKLSALMLKPRISRVFCGPAKAVPWLQSYLFNQL
jgi:hypothetical protein